VGDEALRREVESLLHQQSRADEFLQRPALELAAAQAGAAIGCWDAKYAYHLWRPITAIRETADDQNAATTPDPSFTSVPPPRTARRLAKRRGKTRVRRQASGSLENASALSGNLDDETLHVPDDL
jgi:hypothetical protein